MNKEGILLINKPAGYTSRDIVNIISKELNTKKVGHTGTLDKDATGVLVLLLGKYTKLTEYLTADDKKYIATFKFGFETNTLDLSGEVVHKSNEKKTPNEIKKTIQSFEGKYMQEVPMYSAVHLDGKRLYKYALKKEDIEVPKRLVDIKKIEIIDVKETEAKAIFLVSKGTYIRSLVRDIGRKLNTYATLTDLIRTKQGNFDIKDTYTLEDIKKQDYQILTVKDIFDQSHFVEVDNIKYKEIINGVEQKEKTNKEIICYTYNNSVVALYKKKLDVYKMYIKLI